MNYKLKEELKEWYDKNYTEGKSEWRIVGSIGKFENILYCSQDINCVKICEIGGGEGSILERLDAIDFADEIYTLDISESSITTIKSLSLKHLISAEVYDGYNIPYPDKFFDLTILSHVLEHVEFPRALLRELKRVSNYTFIEVPREYHHNIDKETNKYLSYGHINAYTPSLLRFLLKTENFNIIKERKGFYSNAVLKFGKKGFVRFKISLFIILRDIVSLIIPEWRRDTMINYYCVLTDNRL
jgi:SAM-dependent methyltransferase